jgi:hypothetical protein
MCKHGNDVLPHKALLGMCVALRICTPSHSRFLLRIRHSTPQDTHQGLTKEPQPQQQRRTQVRCSRGSQRTARVAGARICWSQTKKASAQRGVRLFPNPPPPVFRPAIASPAWLLLLRHCCCCCCCLLPGEAAIETVLVPKSTKSLLEHIASGIAQLHSSRVECSCSWLRLLHAQQHTLYPAISNQGPLMHPS